MKSGRPAFAEAKLRLRAGRRGNLFHLCHYEGPPKVDGNLSYIVAAVTVIIMPFTLSLSKGTVVVRQAHHERIDYHTFLCKQALVFI